MKEDYVKINIQALATALEDSGWVTLTASDQFEEFVSALACMLTDTNIVDQYK
jgi:hypothetical protein